MKRWLYLIGLMLFFVANTNAANSGFFGVREVVAAKGVTNTVTRSESVLGHIFRNAPGYVY